MFDRYVVQPGSVEKVMEFCTPAESRFVLRTGSCFEQSLVRQWNFLLFKALVCRVQKAARSCVFKDRREDHTAGSVASARGERGERYGEYTEARNEMLTAPPVTLVRALDHR